MLSILYSVDRYDFLNEQSATEIENLRQEFKCFPILNLERQRPILISEKKLNFFTFQGTRTNGTIQFLFSIAGINSFSDEDRGVLEITNSWEDLQARWVKWQFTDEELNGHILQRLELYPSWLSFSKWAAYLPVAYQVKLLKQDQLDLDTAFGFLDQVLLVNNE